MPRSPTTTIAWASRSSAISCRRSIACRLPRGEAAHSTRVTRLVMRELLGRATPRARAWPERSPPVGPQLPLLGLTKLGAALGRAHLPSPRPPATYDVAMSSTIPLGRVEGIGIEAHWTWLLVVVLIV